MKKIITPLKLQMKRAEVGHLHQALLALGFEIAEKKLQEQRFGAATRKAVLAFQEKHALEPTGVVDEPTASRINAQVELSAPGKPPAPRVVRVHVYHANKSPFANASVFAVDKDQRGENPLGDTLTDARGYYEIPCTEEVAGKFSP